MAIQSKPIDHLQDYVPMGIHKRTQDETAKEMRAMGKEPVTVDHKALEENAKKFKDVSDDVAKMDFQKWMKLTLAGFQNQDPMNPKDPGSITAELANVGMAVGFSKIPKMLDEMKAVMNKSMSMGASQRTGQIVEVQHNEFTHPKGDTRKLSFDLPISPNQVQITVHNETNHEVRRMTIKDGQKLMVDGKEIVVNLKAGRNTFEWDGLDGKGIQAPTGKYRFEVKALDPDGHILKDPDSGKKLNIRKYIEGTLDATFYDDQNGNMATVDGIDVKFDDIKKFSSPSLAQTQDAGAASGAAQKSKTPLPEHPQPHMVNDPPVFQEAHPSFSAETEKKWQAHQEKFMEKFYTGDGKNLSDLDGDTERLLKKYNIDVPRAGHKPN